RRSVLWLGRGVRTALSLSRLALGAHRPMPATAVRGDGAPGRAFQGPRPHQGLCRRGQGRSLVGLSRAAPGAARADLGAVHVAERLRADRVLGGPLQLVPVPGELDRSRALRVAALELVALAEP